MAKATSAHVRRGPVPAEKTIRIGFIGAGNYASSMLLPNIAGRPGIELARVATRRSLSAINAKRKFTFDDAGTNVEAVLEDDSIDVVFVVTRHSSHAALVCQALEAGKTVFVEKPLAISNDQLDMILATVDATGNDRLMVGFNRRFAPMLQGNAQPFWNHLRASAGPVLCQRRDAGGNQLVRQRRTRGIPVRRRGRPLRRHAQLVDWRRACRSHRAGLGGRGNLQVSVRYDDGSLGTITYFANGNARFPKETFEAVCGGRVARLDNFKKATVWSGRRQKSSRTLGRPDKGPARRIGGFLRGGSDRWPDADLSGLPGGYHPGDTRGRSQPRQRDN